MESVILVTDPQDAIKCTSDKIIEEILNENQNNYDVLGQSSESELENNSVVVEKELETEERIAFIDATSNHCSVLGNAHVVHSLVVSNGLQVLHHGVQEESEIVPIPGDVEFRVIHDNESMKNESEHSQQLVSDELEQQPSENVVLDSDSSTLTTIDDLSNYTDTHNVLIPKFVGEDPEDITLSQSTTEAVGVKTHSIQSSLTEEVDLPAAQTSQTVAEIISLPVASNTATVNPAIVGVAELDGNIVSIGGQHFILFTGVSQTNPVLDSVATVVTHSSADNPIVLNQDETAYEPAEKKQKTDESLLPSSVTTDLDTGIENLVGFHSPQPNVIEVVEEDKSEGACGEEEGKDGPTDITQAWFTTRDDKYKLQSKGSTWKQGQWSKDEVELLQGNIACYCQEHNITDPTEVIFEMSKDERKNFYRTIAVGLNRPLFSVYRRVIRMYDQKNHIGRYSPEEVQKLKELRKRLGTDWAAIGAELGRSASSVKDRCRLMKDQCYTGKWLPEEEKLLTNAVFRLTGAMPGIDVTMGLSWAAVAEQVGTRTEKQCRTKWLNYLNWKQRGGTEWTRADDLALIDKIANLNAGDETHINWEQLSKDWTSVRSPQWLRGKWWSLKRTVPDYQILSFPQIISTLKTNSKNLLRNNMRSESVPYAVKMDPPPSVLQQSAHMLQNPATLLDHGGPPIVTVSGPTDENKTQSQYIVTSSACYELALQLPVRVASGENQNQSSESGGLSLNHAHLIEGQQVIEINPVDEEQQSVITYTEGGSDSPQPVVLAYPGVEDSSCDSRGVTIQQQNPMMSSAVKNDD